MPVAHQVLALVLRHLRLIDDITFPELFDLIQADASDRRPAQAAVDSLMPVAHQVLALVLRHLRLIDDITFPELFDLIQAVPDAYAQPGQVGRTQETSEAHRRYHIPRAF